MHVLNRKKNKKNQGWIGSNTYTSFQPKLLWPLKQHWSPLNISKHLNQRWWFSSTRGFAKELFPQIQWKYTSVAFTFRGETLGNVDFSETFWQWFEWSSGAKKYLTGSNRRRWGEAIAEWCWGVGSFGWCKAESEIPGFGYHVVFRGGKVHYRSWCLGVLRYCLPAQQVSSWQSWSWKRKWHF